jgi:hypothetical protein
MSFVARSRTGSVGAEIVNPQPPNFTGHINLQDYGFDRPRYDHSGQFLRDIQWLYSSKDGKVHYSSPLYRRLMDDLDISPPAPPQ